VIAYVARYGRTPPSESLRMSMPDLVLFMRAIGDLIEKEKAAASTENAD
jgi:hypothetical protein